MIIDTLIEKIKQTDNPTVVGLDPRLSYIPDFIKKDCYKKLGKTPSAVLEAFWQFNKAIIDATYDLIPAVKPQIAMYEQFGAEGIACYIKTIAYAKEMGLIVIGDIKRSDIASTAEAYSDGHIGKVQIEENCFEIYREDFITLNPYLGWDSIEPYMENCKNYEKGLFILVKTSNPNSGQLQDLKINGNMTLYEKVGELTEEWGISVRGKYGYSSVGAVVGATHSQQAQELRKKMPHTFFLVPGYGAQGGTAEDLSVCFDKNGLGAIINSSRGIIAAYQNKKYEHFSEKEFAQASRQAVIDMRDDLNRVR